MAMKEFHGHGHAAGQVQRARPRVAEFLGQVDLSPAWNDLVAEDIEDDEAGARRVRVRAVRTAELDTNTYERGIKITDKQIAALEATQLHRHAFHGGWNYTLTAACTATRPAAPYQLLRGKTH